MSNCYKVIASFFFSVLLASTALTPVVFGQMYVDKDATGAGDGSSWTDAYTNLGLAIRNGSSSDEIWIAEGTYKPATIRDSSFVINGDRDGLGIYGGFSGTESQRSARDPAKHPVVLSGNIGAQDDSLDNSYHVVIFDGGYAAGIGTDRGTNVTEATVLSGVTITGGVSNESWDSDGGGIYCDGVGDNNECSPTLDQITFRNNSADDVGGAIYNNAGAKGISSPRIVNSTFVGNEAENGGAIYNASLDGAVSSPHISGTTFRNNSTSDLGGGAIYSSGGYGTTRPTIINCTFMNNSGPDGGAIYMYAQHSSGVSSAIIINSLFVGNNASSQGGGIYNYATSDATSKSLVLNTTFTDNSAYKGGAIYNYVDSGTNSPTITNSILWGNSASYSGDEIYNSGANPKLTHTLVEGGIGGITEDNGSSTTDGGGNVDADPQFAGPSDPDGADDVFSTSDDGLRLTDGSPALDAGINDSLDIDGNGTRDVTTDFTGGPRVTDNDADNSTPAVVDVGAYEAASNVQLPVELATLEAQRVENEVVLAWKTASETNNTGFVVQRKKQISNAAISKRADQWLNLSRVEGAGTTSQSQSYRYTDVDLPYEADRLTYRLKQVDTDGTAHYSETVTVERGVTKVQLLSTYPNPARQQATVRYALPEKQTVSVRLYDVLGQQVRTVVSGKQEGRHEQAVDVSELSSGVYFLRLQAGGQVRTQKITILR